MSVGSQPPPAGPPAAVPARSVAVPAEPGPAAVPAGPAAPVVARPSAAAGPTALGPAPGVRATLGAYLRLTKPRIVLLLLVTTVPAMVLARRGLPSLALVAATLFGGTLAAGGANAINQYWDRDIDRIMPRTRRRPLPARAIEPWKALAFGLALGAVAFAWLATSVNLLSAALSTAAMAFYVVVYTMWLKRRSVQNIVIGGAAGAVPVLVGWSAVTGRVGWPAVVLFAIVFVWTPPHFWALSLRYLPEYRAAGVPMLPVVRGVRETSRQVMAYSVLLVATSFALVPVAHAGWVYIAAAALLGLRFLVLAVRLVRRGSIDAAMALFRYSILYLALLFVAVAVDTLVRFGA